MSAGAPFSIWRASVELDAYDTAIFWLERFSYCPAISSSAFFRLAAASTTASACAAGMPDRANTQPHHMAFIHLFIYLQISFERGHRILRYIQMNITWAAPPLKRMAARTSAGFAASGRLAQMRGKLGEIGGNRPGGLGLHLVVGVDQPLAEIGDDRPAPALAADRGQHHGLVEALVEGLHQ